jgi:tetratricopeptide (TPR) repeat protein
MLGRIALAFSILLSLPARSADIGRSQTDADRLTASGDRLFRQSQFEEAESAYSRALDLDPHNVRGHLGIGKIAMLLSDRDRAVKQFSAAYQAAPRDPDAILAFAGVVEDREARQTLLRNFLALSSPTYERTQDVAARLHAEEQLGERKIGQLENANQPYRLPLANLSAGGLILHARLNSGSELRLILDTGATGITLNASSGRKIALEFLAPAALWGYGAAPPTPARLALADRFQTAELKIANLLVEVSETELTLDADGFIGLDVFKDFLIHIDPLARKLELSPLGKTSCAACTKAYRLGHLLLIRGEVDGHGGGYFILDTGTPYTLISRKLMPRSGTTSTMSGANGDQAVILPARSVALRLGDKHLWGFPYATLDTDVISSTTGAAIAGAIGYSLLRDFSLTIDYRTGLVRLGTKSPDR